MKRFFYTCFFIGLVFTNVVYCFAQKEGTIEGLSPEILFSLGNDYYEEAKYNQAAGKYEAILSQGYESAAVYYNLAGAYFKAGELGKAVLNYERAKILMPRDADIKANYRFASAMVKGKIIPAKTIWTWRPFRIYSANFTIDELTWLCSGIYLVIIILLFIAFIRPDVAKYQFVTASVLFICILFSTAVIWRKSINIDKGAVVITSRVDAMFGPFDSATKFFTLYEGMNVTVLNNKGDWCKTKCADNKIGWLKKTDLEKMETNRNAK